MDSWKRKNKKSVDKSKRNPFSDRKSPELNKNPFKNKESNGNKENKHPRESDDFRNPFSNKPDANDQSEKPEHDDDFFYLAGAAESANVRVKPDEGRYRFDWEVKNEDWLRDSIKNRMDEKTSKDIPIKPTDDGLHRYRGGDKELVKDMANYKNNPEKLRDLPKEKQDAWLNGYFDAKATVGEKRNPEGNVKLTDKDLDKLRFTQDKLADKDIDSKIEKSEGESPFLKIEGADNLRKLADELKWENEEKREKLEDEIKKAELRESPEFKDYNQIRSDIGNEFGDFVKDNVKHLRPDAEDYKPENPRDEDGKKIDPEAIIKHPDGSVEAIDAKLHDGLINRKDADYAAKHPEVDKVTAPCLEDTDKEEKMIGDTPVKVMSPEGIRGKLEEAKDKAKSKEEKKEIDKQIKRFDNLRRKAKESKEKQNKKDKKDKDEENKKKEN